MAEDRARSPLWMAVTYALIGSTVILLGLLPLSRPAHSVGENGEVLAGFGALLLDGLQSPDVLMMLTFAWLLRRPDQLPFWLIALMFFLRDLLTGAPPGIGALTVLVATELLRRRQEPLREVSFLVECGNVVVFAGVAMGLARVIMAALFLPLPPLGLQFMVLISSILAYPFTVFALRLMLGLRKTAPGSLDDRGHRI